MTTTPTPETFSEWYDEARWLKSKDRDRSARYLEDAARACEALIAERDQALARVKELEADKDDVARRLIRMETGG